MVEPVGKRLQKARLEAGLTIDAAADATKIRPERLTDLESDDYSNFPNLMYAKGFLANYARFLKLDIQEELDTFQVSSSVSLRDYQYAEPNHPRYVPNTRWRENSRGFRVPPIVVFALVLVVLVGVPLLSYFGMNFSQSRKGEAKAMPSPNPPSGQLSPSTTQDQQALQSLVQNVPPTADNAPRALSASPNFSPTATPSAGPAGTERNENGIEVRRALPVASHSVSTQFRDQPANPSSSNSVPEAGPPALAKLEVRALKRTRITLTKDERGSEPVFDGMAGPGSQPIVAEGARFWLKVRDKKAVEVRKNGQIVATSVDGIEIN
jgi:cytoskeletal protein RodZ